MSIRVCLARSGQPIGGYAKIGDDGIERVTTQTLFDVLEIPQRSRGTAACRRLAKLMSRLRWM
jgi:hypothetical protein